MQTKTAIIILTVVVFISGMFMVYLFGYMDPIVRRGTDGNGMDNDKNNSIGESSSREEAMRRAVLEAEAENPSIIDPSDTEALKAREEAMRKAVLEAEAENPSIIEPNDTEAVKAREEAMRQAVLEIE